MHFWKTPPLPGRWRGPAVVLLVSFLAVFPVRAGFYSNLWSPGTVPWPGGVVPRLLIDATTQPGYAGKPLIVLSGAQLLRPEAGEVPGLLIYAANCAVKGLSVRNFPWVGIALRFQDATGNTIAGCWCGVDHTGSGAASNAKQGIQISDGARNNVIGGSTAADRNVISGNTDSGIRLEGAGVDGNTVQGNFLGLNASGTGAVPNTFAGIQVLSGAKINVVSDNVLSGNGCEGCRFAGVGTTGNVAKRNLVGTNTAGTAAVPNGFAGLTIFFGPTGNTLGGTSPGDGNLVSGNATYGVVIGHAGSSGNFVQGNTIGLGTAGTPVANGLHGVALWDGAQGNPIGGTNAGAGNIIQGNSCVGIALGGANRGQAAPAMSTATLESIGTTVTGILTSSASATFRIEFFASDPPGFGHGATYLGALDGVTTNDTGGGMGTVAFDLSLPAIVSAGQVITATATDTSTGDTSEFSPPVTVTTTDSDGDGMPDGYEMANGLDKNVNDAAPDLDGDGQSNFAEFQAGTDPQTGESRFAAKSVERVGDDIVVTFHAVPGRVYRIEKTETLMAGSWRVIVTFVVATGPDLQVTDPGAGLRPRGFYRAGVVP